MVLMTEGTPGEKYFSLVTYAVAERWLALLFLPLDGD